MATLTRWLQDNPVITIALLLITIVIVVWMLMLFSAVTLAVFGFLGEIPNVPGTGGTVAAYATVFGITATVAGLVAGAKQLWQWRMDKKSD